jgi:hypothetical protein
VGICGLGLRAPSSSAMLLRPLFVVCRAMVVRRRFGLSQLMSLGMVRSLRLLLFVCLYTRVKLNQS